MATKGTRNTRIDFGGFEIAVSMSKAHRSRDIKTEVVNSAGEKVSMGGGGGRRALRDGEQRAVRQGERLVRIPQPRLDAIEATSHERWEQMRVLETIDYRQVPTERILGSYWLQPAEGSARTMALLAAALRETGKVAIVKWVASSREKLGVIRVRGQEGRRALLLSELAFANDFAEPDADALEVNHVDVDERSLGIAVGLIESFARQKGDEPAVDTATDEAVDARVALFCELAEAATTDELEHAAAEAGGELVELRRSAA